MRSRLDLDEEKLSALERMFQVPGDPTKFNYDQFSGITDSVFTLKVNF